ncbi:bifunctional adenosylcobinamide kinase/adenosylcobinamide-phosphate guanylyltransferase [Marinimicrobium sp. ABcell2]|uniref:bifunctional adenosylcobinamide kinase/adenosylcobinamide-phosphate guanylyltransferase n=1 Tax=Marinimicrobium sp. ABcell2 TaxID=3069751 RepID=UPI0027AE3E78|nr:bifunctional adenosylcobinamide kinase/adenosylcobinamide-phosphate guanylyltransferase [Marinimicrobium sp. ABcell2]MDQ2076733.1 bifunctional adenosylcobinamide kinase/adenosylcobinamide-phosphate guanylyltransferase [Marinimicrobium sp. ABcell2]
MPQLILGGARSGKSRMAERRAREWTVTHGGELMYVATGAAGDEEMTQRIAIHRERRGPEWELIEEPEDLAGVLATCRNRRVCLVVDCLTLWVSNCLHKGSWDQQRERLLTELKNWNQSSPQVIFVSNEVGSGIVPLGELSRQFVDASGWLHQALAEVCERVTLVVAGLPMELKHQHNNEQING